MAESIKKRRRDGFWHAIGILLYDIGFQAEYTVYRLWRALVRLVFLCGTLLHWIGNGLVSHLKPFFVTVGQELVAPWYQLREGFRNLRTFVRQQRSEGSGSAARQGMAYFVHGVQTYKGLLHRGLAYLMPLGAACVFLFTAYNVLSATYALRVEYNGEFIGFIADETVYAQAQRYVQARIRGTQSDEWKMHPTLKIVSVNKAALMNKEELANKMVAATGSEIVEGVGVLVDGTLIGATTETKELNRQLEALREPYLDPNNKNLRAEFIQDVQRVSGYYLKDTVLSADMLMKILSGQAPYYAGDEEAAPVNMLRVKQVERVTFQQEVPYSSIEVDDATLDWGRRVVTQQGSDGLEEVTQDITYVDGVETGRTTLYVDTIIGTVDEVVSLGVLSEYGIAGEVGTGKLIWPVPGYTGVSRGISAWHRGADITARQGTPIYACDNGVVKFAGNDRGGYNWSYGNYVMLDHGNGMTTLYGHMVAVRDGLRTGDYVKQGDLIGYVGSTGLSTGNHLHLEVAINGTLQNPFNYVTRPK